MKKPKHQRKTTEYPCKIHGDPRLLMSENAAYVELFQELQPYSEVREVEQGGKAVRIPMVNIAVLKIFCDAGNLDFFELLHKMNVIQEALNG